MMKSYGFDFHSSQLVEDIVQKSEHESDCSTCSTIFFSDDDNSLRRDQFEHNIFLSPEFIFSALRVRSLAFCQSPVWAYASMNGRYSPPKSGPKPLPCASLCSASTLLQSFI